MNQQFKSFLETSCFSSNYPFSSEMGEGSFEEQDAKRELIRKLSFRDNFDFSQETTDDSGDFFSDAILARKRKMTNEMDLLDKVCLTYEDSPQRKNSDDQISKMVLSSPHQHPMGIENYSHMSNLANRIEGMEEEYDDTPIVKEFESEMTLMEKVNNNDHSSHSHDLREPPHRGNLEVQTVYTFKQENSPSSCLVKTGETESFESPAPGKRFNNSSLTTCRNLRDPDLRTITPETLVSLMNDSQRRKYLVIDCRYEYEYKGGHIRGAVNITSPEDLETLLVKNRHLLCKDDTLELVKKDWTNAVAGSRMRPSFKHEDPLKLDPPILVFHCEFSQKRGPRALRALRNLDRNLNSMTWPNLFYPEVYILENGYKNFHSKFPEYCDPIGVYIRMVDKIYKPHYIEAKTKDRTVWKTKDTKDTTEETLKPTVLQRFKTMVCI